MDMSLELWITAGDERKENPVYALAPWHRIYFPVMGPMDLSLLINRPHRKIEEEVLRMIDEQGVDWRDRNVAKLTASVGKVPWSNRFYRVQHYGLSPRVVEEVVKALAPRSLRKIRWMFDQHREAAKNQKHPFCDKPHFPPEQFEDLKIAA